VVKLERETSGDRREGSAYVAARGSDLESSTRLRESVTISRGSSHAFDAAGLEPGFGVSATSGDPYGVGAQEQAGATAGTVPSDWQVSSSSDDAVLPAHGPGDSGQDEERRTFKLVGSQLVEATKRKRPPRKTSKKPSSKKKKTSPKAHSKKRGRTTKVSRDPATEYQAARSLYTSGKFIEAEQAFERFARAHPGHEYADNALYWKGEAAYDQRHFSDALAAFTEVIERYGGGNKASDALLKIGLCYGKIGDTANAKDVLEQLVLAYPNARASSIANKKLAEMSGVQQ
jgi:tol-pal system protein YbgF